MLRPNTHARMQRTHAACLHAHEHQEGMQLHSVQECCMWHTRTPVLCGSTVRMWGGWGLHSSMKFALLHACRATEAHPMHAFGHAMKHAADAVAGIHRDELSMRHVGPQPSRLTGVGGAMPIYASSHGRFAVVHAYCSHLKWGRWPFKGA